MPFITPNSVVLVTASSAGLGAATARAFASRGANIVINYHSSHEKAAALLHELKQLSPTPARFHSIRADVSQRTELIRLVAETVKEMGRLDVVVSNQGWTRMRNFLDLEDNVDEEDWDRCFNVNVKSHLFLFHAAKPYLEESRGSFITVASLAGVQPSGSSVAYSVTKAAQIHLVKSLALIGGPVRVNSVSPGILLTDWGAQFPKEKIEGAVQKSVLKRLAIIEDVATQIVTLADSISVTGTNSVIDAGWSL